MNRRRVLAACASGAAAGSSGCIGTITGSGTVDPGENDSEDVETDEKDDFRFAGVYADERDRDFVDGEYVLLQNDSEESLDVSGYVVEYSADRTYRITDLVLEPGAQLVISSGEGQDSILQSSPPVYLRYAGFDAGSTTSVLGETGTVHVRNANGTTVAETSYETFGCDGGTVTDRSGDEIECLH